MTASRAEPTPLPWYGFVGLAILVSAELLLAGGSEFVAHWFTPIMWTGYFLLADAFVHRMSGVSWLLTRRREFPFLILLSVAVWLLFEAYNLHLQNWIYEGVPADPLLRSVNYFWSFATIMPGVFVTADLIAILFRNLPLQSSKDLFPGASWIWFLVGGMMITIPLAFPSRIAQYLFAPVWIGFFLLLDPINERLGAQSLRASLRRGDFRLPLALVTSGLICGFLWEAWNLQALRAGGAYWIYTIPEALRLFGWHFGQMPLLGMLGFPPFALELHAMYFFLREMLGGERVLGPFVLGPRAASEAVALSGESSRLDRP